VHTGFFDYMANVFTGGYAVQKTVPITIRFPEEIIERLKTLARKRSAKADKDISYTDLIRGAVQEKYFDDHGRVS
jgi:predicted DNA-binding protein